MNRYQLRKVWTLLTHSRIDFLNIDSFYSLKKKQDKRPIFTVT